MPGCPKRREPLRGDRQIGQPPRVEHESASLSKRGGLPTVEAEQAERRGRVGAPRLTGPEKIATLKARGYLAERAARAKPGDFGHILAKARTADPVPGDERPD